MMWRGVDAKRKPLSQGAGWVSENGGEEGGRGKTDKEPFRMPRRRMMGPRVRWRMERMVRRCWRWKMR